MNSERLLYGDYMDGLEAEPRSVVSLVSQLWAASSLRMPSEVLTSMLNRLSPCMSFLVVVVAASGGTMSSSLPISGNGKSLNVVASMSETSFSAEAVSPAGPATFVLPPPPLSGGGSVVFHVV